MMKWIKCRNKNWELQLTSHYTKPYWFVWFMNVPLVFCISSICRNICKYSVEFRNNFHGIILPFHFHVPSRQLYRYICNIWKYEFYSKVILLLAQTIKDSVQVYNPLATNKTTGSRFVCSLCLYPELQLAPYSLVCAAVLGFSEHFVSFKTKGSI